MHKQFSDEDGGDLAGKVALVLGGTGLVGTQVCRRLAARGASIGVQHHRSSLDPVLGSRGSSEILDIRLDAQVAGAGSDAVRQVSEALGPPTILVNCYHPHFDPKPISESTYDKDWTGHLGAMRFYVDAVTAAIPEMRAARFGRCVFVSGALSARSLRGCAPYATVKAGLHAFQRHLALEEGVNGITANTVAPGRVTGVDAREETSEWRDVNRTNEARFALGSDPDANDVAAATTYLCGVETGAITGQVIYLARGEVMPA